METMAHLTEEMIAYLIMRLGLTVMMALIPLQEMEMTVEKKPFWMRHCLKAVKERALTH